MLSDVYAVSLPLTKEKLKYITLYALNAATPKQTKSWLKITAVVALWHGQSWNLVE